MDTRYDDYDSYAANKMSGVIKPYVSNDNCTNNNEQAYIPNGTKSNEDSSGVSLGKPNLNDNQDTTSTSSGEEGVKANGENEDMKNELSKFAKYFGPSLDCLKDVFEVQSVFGKLKCLTKSLTKVTNAVQELRQQVLENVDEDNEFCLAITADDLLPLMVLIILQMDSADAAAIVVELKMMQDLIPKFLSFGCHGWALVEYDMASKVLHSLCTQFDWSTSFSPPS
jgi:molecular chaperone GrpE (heat shock protein)